MDFANEAFQKKIEPFRWMTLEENHILSLEIGEGYLAELFLTREAEGFLGNGYDWESLAQVFIEEQFKGHAEDFEFDSEADAFVVYCEDGEALAEFAIAFKEACEDAERIADLFSRAELQ